MIRNILLFLSSLAIWSLSDSRTSFLKNNMVVLWFIWAFIVCVAIEDSANVINGKMKLGGAWAEPDCVLLEI